MLGRPAEGLTRETLRDIFLSAFTEVLGPDGTWVLPAYTYSYTRGEVYDPAATEPANMGLLSEMCWALPTFHRSTDPIFSLSRPARARRNSYEMSPTIASGMTASTLG